MENLIIRTLKSDDLLDVHALWKEAGLLFRPMGRDSLSRIGQEIRETRNFVLGAYLGHALVGVALGSDDGRKGWINRVAVRPAYRKQGIAHMLIAHCEKIFQTRGLGLVCCLIDEENTPSLELFNKEGYKLHREILYLKKPIGVEEW